MFKAKHQNSLITVFLAVLIITLIPVFLSADLYNEIITPSMAQSSNTTNNNNNTSPLFSTSGQSNPDANFTVAMTGLPDQGGFSVRVIASNLSAPHNILYGPDGTLWITERVGKNIIRVNPESGDILSIIPVPGVYQTGGQDGLMGMAFDPSFNDTGHIYLAYTYDADSKEGEEQVDRRTKITRFTYNQQGATIGDPQDIISGLAGSTDHNSGRIIFGHDGKLYYTIGDQGNNQFDRYCMPIKAQILPTLEQIEAKDWSSYQGKVLRINPDGSIPEDNPVIDGVKSHIFTYGHRNHQGITLANNGHLYIVEHGDKTDDEFSRIEEGGNYGWPNVAGYIDNKAYQYANWSGAENCEELKFNNIAPFPPSVPVLNESQFNQSNFVPPIQTFYTVNNDYNFSQPAGCGYVCWPTVAPSSIQTYPADAIPGWNGTLLMTTLKAGSILHLSLHENGTALSQEPQEIFRSENRYRDLAFSPDGKIIYVITDSSGPVLGIERGPIVGLNNPGSILEFRYEGRD